MSNELKKPKNKEKQSNIEVVFINTELDKDGKLIDDKTQGRTMLEFMLDVDYIDLKLGNHQVDKNGNRYDSLTGELLSEKGKKEKPVNKKSNIQKENDGMDK